VHFTDPELDPRLAGLYDDNNRATEDFDFFKGVIARRPGARVLDLGCGTGTLTTALALDGFLVTGIDPNPAFLAIAAAKPGADRVTWIRGTSADAPEGSFDVALMTSHAAQVFLSDVEWAATLADLKRSLVPRGLLAFDTRDPAAEAWKNWENSDRVALADGAFLDSSVTVTFRDGIAWGDYVYAVSDGSLPQAEVLAGPRPGTMWARSKWGYRFRPPELVRRSLEEAGFVVEHLYGGWHEERVGEGVGEIVVLATA
jgi:SAM-dependent methyltransferase